MELWFLCRLLRSWRARTRSQPRSGCCPPTKLNGQLAPNRRVVRRSVFGPRLLVDVAGGNPVHRMWRQQQVVDPQPLVSMPTPRLVVPEGIAVRLAMKDAVG